MMRWAVMLCTGGFVVSVCAAELLEARAQQVSPAAVAEAGSDPAGDDARHQAPFGDQHRMAGWQQGHAMAGGVPATLGLLFTAPDRRLSQADVQKIAEAYLLWHGNHDWRITNLASDVDRVTFTIATGQDAVIATFAMDRHTGALSRTG